MRAYRLHQPAHVESRPLRLEDVPVPEPGRGEVRIRVAACAICRTDLHVIEGELAPRRSPIVPGHQVVGRVERVGEGCDRLHVGDRVGVAWLHRTCGRCEYCSSGKENLCDAPDFTGYTVDGGYAEQMIAAEPFVYPLPEDFDDLAAAPLLCAGIIGYRALRLSGIEPGGRLGLWGFGAAAHVAIQVARHRGVEVFAVTRDERHRRFARELGAAWVGSSADPLPAKLDAGIIFAPAGELVPAALATLKKGATLALGGIHMSPIPSLDYALLYGERVVRSVANNTRQDGEEFLRLAAEIPIHTEIEVYAFESANEALAKLKLDAVRGAAVIAMRRRSK